MEKTALQKLIEQYTKKINDTPLFIEKEILKEVLKDLEAHLKDEKQQILKAYRAGAFDFRGKDFDVTKEECNGFYDKSYL